MTERTLAGVRTEGGRGVVTVQDVYDTTVEDLWAAITQPERLRRWIAEVEGDLRVGGRVTMRFTSSWSGTGEVRVCEAPHRLVVASREDDGSETEIEAVVSPEGDRARLVVEERGLPEDPSAYAAGWQVHLEDLGAALAGRPTSDWEARWHELIGGYRPAPAGEAAPAD
jgi:uncharacterized protein YndB with AHSA1/START domain